MTTHRIRLNLIAAVVLTLAPAALGGSCGTSSTSATPDLRHQPRPRAEPTAAPAQPTTRSSAPAQPATRPSAPAQPATRSSAPLKPGTREYKRKLEELTDIRPGSLDVHTDCRSGSRRGKSNCRDCARAIRRLRPRAPIRTPDPPPRAQGSMRGPM